MYLKRLEIQGFKSFPEKTGLDFTTGITSIVGPNGSGKSNIADATRWALGEMSVKSLRGGKMEDIIFSGTNNRRALSYAEVSLIIDNTDRKMPLEFTDVKVTRRVYRTGEGEFFLNGVSCRLKDIYELFMDTGVGREGYSIIGQGRIDEILSARSDDRRLLFEEAAGIVKYKSRRAEAQAKLEKKRQNLLRVGDIIAEIEAQLGPLKEQSDMAKRFLALSERLKLVRVNIFLREAAGSEEKIADIQNRINELETSAAEAQNNETDAKNRLSDLKNEYDGQNAILKTYDNELINIKLAAEKGENNIRVLTEKISHTDKDIARINADIEKKQEDLSAKDTVKDGFVKHRASLAQRLDALNADLTSHQADFDLVSVALAESEGRLNAYNQSIYEKISEIAEKKGDAEKLSLVYAQLEERKEQLNTESEANGKQIAEGTQKTHELEERIKTANKEISESKNKLAFYDSEAAALKTQLNEKTQALSFAHKNYNTAKARLKLLRELEEGYEGYNISVKSILTRKKETGAFKNIHGAAGTLLTTAPEYETAIETALGGFIQNLVTETEQDTVDAIAYLKENRLGRATFLPISAIAPKELGRVRDRIDKERGFIGIAKELTSYAALYENIFSHILGRVVVIDNLDNALRIFKKYDYQVKIVTLEGELLNVGGAITGGAREHTGAKLFGRAREISSLAEQTEMLKQTRDELTTQLENINEKLRNADVKRAELSDILQNANLDIAALSQALTQANNTQDELATRRNTIKQEDDSLFAEIISLNKRIREMNAAAAHCEGQLAEIKNDLKRYQDELAEGREEKDIKVKRLTDLKIEIASAAEKIKSTDLNIKRLDDEKAARQSEIERHIAELSALAEKKQGLEASIEETRSSISELNQNRAETEEKITMGTNAAAALDRRITETENDISEINKAKASIDNELTRQTMRLEQAQDEIRRLYDLMWDEYELTYNTAKQYERIEKSVKELSAEERALKDEIRELGSVNVGAIEEYRLKKERYEFLSAQRDDILEAEIALDKLITELNASMERQFKKQLNIISDNFNTVFAEMFGGGQAGIAFTNPDNILESGIEITARPPGKTLRVLSLLSGGEKTLTAMALLFAILRMKPSPFCVLDEIDAALDEANVVRFTNFLKNYSLETQFILITHKKGTMAIADALYGVTMQEQGVSKLVSVNLVS